MLKVAILTIGICLGSANYLDCIKSTLNPDSYDKWHSDCKDLELPPIKPYLLLARSLVSSFQLAHLNEECSESPKTLIETRYCGHERMEKYIVSMIKDMASFMKTHELHDLEAIEKLLIGYEYYEIAKEFMSDPYIVSVILGLEALEVDKDLVAALLDIYSRFGEHFKLQSSSDEEIPKDMIKMWCSIDYFKWGLNSLLFVYDLEDSEYAKIYLDMVSLSDEVEDLKECRELI